MKILVIDDEEATLNGIARLLEKMGHTCVTASSSAAGLELARREDVDAAIVDCWMPSMTGFDALHELAAARPDIPVILTSAMATPGTERAAVEQGAVAFIDKADIPRSLRQLLESLPNLSDRAEPASEKKPRPAPSSHGVILLADDHEAFRRAAGRVLAREGYIVVEAANGADAVATWKKGGIDAAIIDIHMPDMSGLDAARLIRADDPRAMIALISGEASRVERQAGSEYARMGCIDKMFGTERLGRIANFLVKEARRIRNRPRHAGRRQHRVRRLVSGSVRRMNAHLNYWQAYGDRRLARIFVAGLAVAAILAIVFLNMVNWYEARIFDLEQRQGTTAIQAPGRP